MWNFNRIKIKYLQFQSKARKIFLYIIALMSVCLHFLFYFFLGIFTVINLVPLVCWPKQHLPHLANFLHALGFLEDLVFLKQSRVSTSQMRQINNSLSLSLFINACKLKILILWKFFDAPQYFIFYERRPQTSLKAFFKATMYFTINHYLRLLSYNCFTTFSHSKWPLYNVFSQNLKYSYSITFLNILFYSITSNIYYKIFYNFKCF